MSKVRFGMHKDELKELAKNTKPDVRTGTLLYKDLTDIDKERLCRKFIRKRQNTKRRDAIIELSVEENVTPAAISQLLREDYNNFG